MKTKFLVISMLAALAFVAAPVNAYSQMSIAAICENSSFQCSATAGNPNAFVGPMFVNTWTSIYGSNLPQGTQGVSVEVNYPLTSGAHTIETLFPVFSSSSQVNVCLVAQNGAELDNQANQSNVRVGLTVGTTTTFSNTTPFTFTSGSNSFQSCS
ncbi:MAG TPA: hypothetical protein VG759_15630 [Candidatus Angelobacter sp.]|nr:hypothetical protein [Candidatus Angelobacter sp.]